MPFLFALLLQGAGNRRHILIKTRQGSSFLSVENILTHRCLWTIQCVTYILKSSVISPFCNLKISSSINQRHDPTIESKAQACHIEGILLFYQLKSILPHPWQLLSPIFLFFWTQMLKYLGHPKKSSPHI